MLTISNNPTRKGLSVFRPNVIYSTASGVELTMDMLIPQRADTDPSRNPVIVFIQGSAWHFPDTTYEIPQLARFSAAGYTVATVRHRNIDDGYPAPAFLQDVKTAIRFLRAHADQFQIDDKQIYSFGTSSGGNTSLLLGLTGDDSRFKTSEYAEYSDSVCAVIDCFGPTDLTAMMPQDPALLDPETSNMINAFCGGTYNPKILQLVSPIFYVERGKNYVPFLIAHGNADPLVPFSQSEQMVKRLEECGADVSFICVDHAEHEGSFWSLPLLDLFIEFFNRQSKLHLIE